MHSAIKHLQKEAATGAKPVTELLRTAKLIAAKLDLRDIGAWIKRELEGYGDFEELPSYREIGGGSVEVLNPVRGWTPVGHFPTVLPVRQPLPELEELSKGEMLMMNLTKSLPLTTLLGKDSLVDKFAQRVVFSPTQMKQVVESVRDTLLEWAIELDKRGVRGDDFDFSEEEKKSATSQTFNIQQVVGVVGNVSHSSVELYNYGSLHQQLKDRGVSQTERNELENIIDELNTTAPDKKASLMERAKKWISKNSEFLGSSAEIVRKALGLPGAN